MYHFMPPTQLFAKPKTPKKKADVIIVATIIEGQRWSIPIPFAKIDGIRGVSPNITKLKKVTIELVKGLYQPAMSCSSQIIIIFKNPSLFLLRISTISVDTAGCSPISLQRCTISAFSASRSFSIYFLYLSSSCIIYQSSLFVPRQSATAIPKPSPIIEAIPRARTVLGEALEPMEEMAMMSVVHSPSSPPYTADLMYSPTELWCQSLL